MGVPLAPHWQSTSHEHALLLALLSLLRVRVRMEAFAVHRALPQVLLSILLWELLARLHGFHPCRCH